MAYIGQNGGGAEMEVVRVCGYKPMTEKACDTIFVKAYLSCRKGFYLSSVQQSWLFGHDPTTSDSSRLERLCEVKKKGRLSRKRFGALMCGGY